MNPLLHPKLLGRTVAWDHETHDPDRDRVEVKELEGTIVGVSTDSDGDFWFLIAVGGGLHTAGAIECMFTGPAEAFA